MSKPETNLEMERGRIIAGRAQRVSDLDRLVKGKKVKVTVALPAHPYYTEACGVRMNIFYVDGVEIGHESDLATNYPSETLMAKILLAVNATVGTEGIPSAQDAIDPAERRRRDEYRKNSLVDWSKL